MAVQPQRQPPGVLLYRRALRHHGPRLGIRPGGRLADRPLRRRGERREDPGRPCIDRPAGELRLCQADDPVGVHGRTRRGGLHVPHTEQRIERVGGERTAPEGHGPPGHPAGARLRPHLARRIVPVRRRVRNAVLPHGQPGGVLLRPVRPRHRAGLHPPLLGSPCEPR